MDYSHSIAKFDYLSSTNDFTLPFGSSSLISGTEDWKDLAHWYREQSWNLDNFNDWAPQGGRPRHKHHRKHHKGHKISGVKGGILKAKITALYVKKIGEQPFYYGFPAF